MAPRWSENLRINSSCSVLVGGSSFVKGWHEAYRQFVFEEHPKDGVDRLGNKSTSESIALSPVVSSFLGLSFLNGDFSLRVWMVFSDIYPRPVHPLSPFVCRFLLVALSRFSFSLRGGPTVHCRIGLNGWCWSSGGGKRGEGLSLWNPSSPFLVAVNSKGNEVPSTGPIPTKKKPLGCTRERNPPPRSCHHEWRTFPTNR